MNVLFIHGIGGNKADAHRTMLKNLKAQLPEGTNVNYFAVNYLKGINKYQGENFSAMNKGKDKKRLRPFKIIRKKLLNAFGDASTIFYDRESYTSVMREIDEGLKTLAETSDAPITVISQSLGCQMFSCYMYDMARRNYYADYQKRIALWITTGCNIRVFTHGLSHRKIHAFVPPNDNFKWFNFWNWGDVLGYPMASLSESYGKLLTKDIHVSWGIPFVSHTKYDSNKKVVKRIAKEIMRL